MNDSKQLEEINDNETDPFLSPLEPNYPQWIAILAIETLFLVLGVYLLAAVVYFTVKNMSDSKFSSVPGGQRLRRIRNILLILLIIYTVTSLFKFCLAQWVFWGPPISSSTDHCALIGALFQAVHSIGATSLFLFLWLRQHSLQQGSKYLSTPSLHIVRFSWSLLVIIIVAGLAATIGVIFTNTPDLFLYIRGTNACSYAELTGLNSIIVYSGYSLVVAMQICILVLFVVVLKRNRQDRATTLKTAKSSDSASRNRIHMLIRNCTIAAAVSSTSNIIVVLIDVFDKGSMSQLVVDAAWDIDNAISLGSIIFCFSNWKEILLPWSCMGNRFKLVLTSATASGSGTGS